MEYNPVLKRNELSSHEKTGRNIKFISVKEANPKRLYTRWFQLYDILEKAKYVNSKKKKKNVSGCWD